MSILTLFLGAGAAVELEDFLLEEDVGAGAAVELEDFLLEENVGAGTALELLTGAALELITGATVELVCLAQGVLTNLQRKCPYAPHLLHFVSLLFPLQLALLCKELWVSHFLQ